jgi:L-lactate dehydrogenase complex protein LldG
MMPARERMLGRLRSAAPQPTPAGAAELDRRIARHYAGTRPSAAARVEALETSLRAARAEVWRASPSQWPEQLAHRLVVHGAKRLLLDTERAEGAALAAALPDEIVATPFERPLEDWKRELFDSVDAGFTVARSGIAATGTLILEPDTGTPRTVSLVPPLHIALVYAGTLHATMYEAALAERWSDGMPTNLVLASGPSKTSDIQQTLAFGAHGPRWMWVIIVTEEEQP